MHCELSWVMRCLKSETLPEEAGDPPKRARPGIGLDSVEFHQ
jgi:hypothetical protein